MLGPVVDCGQIDGEELRLVPVQESHLAAFVRWLNDPQITRYLSMNFGLTRAMEEEWFAALTADPTRVLWAIELGGEHVGNTSIEDIDWICRTGVTGIMIGEPGYWNRGIATAVLRARAFYAFERLNLTALYTEIFSPNDASMRAAQTVGYREYGRKPFSRYVDGAYVDSWLGVLSRDAWQATMPEEA